MKIGIDARFVGPQGTGLGKYTEKLIENLQKIDKKNNYVIFLTEDNWLYLKLENPNFKKVLADVKWYSIDEQLKMAGIFNSQSLDLLHVPHFNVPILYRKKFVVTIHDLIHHNFLQESTTTRNFLVFKIKRLAYKTTIKSAIKRSVSIIAPSNYVKEEIIKTFNVKADKITVTYEAAEEEYFRNRQSASDNRQSTLLYVGNVYPHKNISKLLDAINILKFKTKNLKLTIVCPRDVFQERLIAEIKKRKLKDVVDVKGYLSAKDLAGVFAKSSAYIFPSLSEGFGIPGLNSMASQLPLISSRIPVLKEIYKDAAYYFDPNNAQDIASAIQKVLSDKKLQPDLIKKGSERVKQFSWHKMAQETLNVYEKLNSIL